MCSLEERFVVKLDTEVKAESAFRRDMIVIGGPVTNIVANDLNDRMDVKFNWDEGWSIVSGMSGKRYYAEEDALIARVRNPWDPERTVLILAGLKFDGTKSAVMALTQYYNQVLKNFDKNKDFYCIIRGLDYDGDGKADAVKVLESFSC